MIEKNNRKNKNSVTSNKISEKTMIKPYISHICLNKLGY